MRTIKENGITKHFVFIGEDEEKQLHEVYSELLNIFDDYINEPKVLDRAKDLLTAMYMPTVMLSAQLDGSLDSRIKFLEDNAFQDRARIITLEEKVHAKRDS
jgi:hypothetical protein